MGKKRSRNSSCTRAPKRRSARIQKFQALALPKSFLPASKSSPPVSTTPFPFLSLPLELRQKVYRQILLFPGGVTKKPLTMDRRLNLFLASRQLHAEASEIFFAKNVFQLESHVAEKTPGREPFCPTLSRVQRCVLNLRLTSPLDCTFILSYLSSFIDVLTPKHKLKHLLIVATPDQVECLHPLERLSRVELAQIDVASPFYPYWCSGSPSMGFKMYLAYYKPKAVYQQHLERIMMCDGSEAQKEKIKERLKGEYVSEPELTVALQGEELEKAKMEGGWKGAGEMMFVLNEVLEGMDKILC